MTGDSTLTEIKTTDSKDYYIRASREARAETPDELAARFLRMIDALKEMTPPSAFGLAARTISGIRKIRDRYAEEIAAGLSRSDWGEPILSMAIGSPRYSGRPARALLRGEVECRRVVRIFRTPDIDEILFQSRTGTDVVSHRFFVCAAGDRGRLGPRAHGRLFPGTH